MGRDEGKSESLDRKKRFYDGLFSACYGDGTSVLHGRVGSADIDELAVNVIERLGPRPVCAFRFGSALHGRTSSAQDVDILVIVDGDYGYTRRCFVVDGVPFDFHIVSELALGRFIDMARVSGYQFALAAGEGQIIYDRGGRADSIRSTLRTAYLAGPEEFATFRVDAIRAVVTDYIIDLFAIESGGEEMAVVVGLSEYLLSLFFIEKKTWIHKGKHGYRRMREIDPLLASQFESALHLAVNGDTITLIAVAETILGRAGGPLWHGHAFQIPLAR